MELDDRQHWTIARLTYWYLDRGRVAEAETLARGLLSLNQRDGLAWYYYGEARRRQDDLQEAVRALEEASRLMEGRPDVSFRLGEVLVRLGRRPEARKALRQARDNTEDDELSRRAKVLLKRCQ